MYLLLLPLIPILLTIFYLIRQNYFSSDEPPVVRSWLPFLGSALEFGKDSTQFMAKHRAQLGDIFTVILGGKRMTFILDNTAWDTVFFKPKPTLSFEPFKKDAMIGAFGARPEVANIPEIEKQAHNHYIKYLQTSGLDKMSSTINQHLLTWFQRDRAKHGVGKPIQSNLYELVLQCGFDAGMSTMFGDSFGEGYPQLLQKFKTFDAKFAMLMGGAPNFVVKEAAKARADLIEYMAKENFDGTHSDMMKARQEMFAQTDLTKKDVGGYNLAILWASQSNTLPALFWFVYYVWCDPVALAAVRKEVDQVLEKYGAKESLLITRDALKEMIVLDSCMNEVLRLRTGSITVRAALEDTALELPNGRTLYARKGDSLALFPYLHHHDPHVFKDPESFVWDRFMPVDGKAPVFTNSDGTKCKHTVVAFGGGISMCPGRFFVLNEAKVLAVLMLQLLDFEMEPLHTPPAMEITRCGLGIIPPAADVKISYKYRG